MLKIFLKVTYCINAIRYIIFIKLIINLIYPSLIRDCNYFCISNKCGAHTIPYIENKNSTSDIEHEATTSKISDDQLFYCRQRGLNQEEAVSLIVNGFCKEVLQQLPMEFAVEAQKLVGISLEGSVG